MTPEPRIVAEPVPRKTYSQPSWSAYNRGQTTEKSWFVSLLADLTATIPEPERKNQRGRPLTLADALFCAVYKVWSGLSARRFTTDLEEACDRGFIARVPHFNSVLNVFDSEA